MFDVDVVDHACDDGAAARVIGAPFAPQLKSPPRKRRARRRYSPPVPRTALGALALAMSALTMAALVLLPAALDSVAHTLY